MKTSLKLTIGALVLCSVVALSVWAHSITAVTMSIGMPNQAVQLAGNPAGSVVNVTSDVCPGDDLSFTVTFGTDTQGSSTTFPMNGVPFSVIQTEGPGIVSLSPASFNVDFGVGGVPTPASKTITMTAPTTPGAYTVKVESPGKTTGQGSTKNTLFGGHLIINFTVGDCTQPCVPETTHISVDNFCVVLHQAGTIDLKASLLDSSNTGISGQTLHFSVDGSAVGDDQTDGSGVAMISNIDVSGLAVGDHEILVKYDGGGVPCSTESYAASQSQGNIGVTYGAVSFQQPINADGTSVFKGGVIPVKIKVYDANGATVPDAMPYVYFSANFDAVIGTDAEPLANTNGDNNNLMRYDPIAQQYILNWDISGPTVVNGTYKVWVDLGEGTCGEQHSVVLSISKTGKGVKK